MAVKTAKPKTKGTGTGAGTGMGIAEGMKATLEQAKLKLSMFGVTTGTGWNKVADWLTSKGGKRSPSQVAIYYLGMIEERLRAP